MPELTVLKAVTNPTRCAVAIIGAGFGGIGLAIRLKRAGWHDFIVIEKADRVGGHLAGQHLSGLCLRHSVAPLFTIVCCEGRLVATVSEPSGDLPIFGGLCRSIDLRFHLLMGLSLREAAFDSSAVLSHLAPLGVGSST